MIVLILIKQESAYTKKKIYMRRSKPDKFGLFIQPYLFIYSDMKYRGSLQYIHEIMAIVIFRKRAMTQ